MRLQVNAKDAATSPALFESTCDWESTEQKRLSVVIELTAMHSEFEWICLKRTVVLKSEEFHIHIFFGLVLVHTMPDQTFQCFFFWPRSPIPQILMVACHSLTSQWKGPFTFHFSVECVQSSYT